MHLDALCGGSLGEWEGFLCVASAEITSFITQGLAPETAHGSVATCVTVLCGTWRLSSVFLGPQPLSLPITLL